jgi:mannosyltransferase OCH1-like enzyme
MINPTGTSALVAIPKKIGHIWIGPRSVPEEWLKSWRDHHPDWSYTLYDNDFLASFPFRNRRLIDEYVKRGQFAGAADLMRYEILYEFGGFIPEADSFCVANTDELFQEAKAYTVYESEKVRPGLVSPILACERENRFVGVLIEELSRLSPYEIGQPWKTTGNRFVAQMIEKYQPDITIFPSHYFIPEHFTGETYEGDGKVYCQQMFGSTTKVYKDATFFQEVKIGLGTLRGAVLRRLFKSNRLR